MIYFTHVFYMFLSFSFYFSVSIKLLFFCSSNNHLKLMGHSRNLSNKVNLFISFQVVVSIAIPSNLIRSHSKQNEMQSIFSNQPMQWWKTTTLLQQVLWWRKWYYYILLFKYFFCGENLFSRYWVWKFLLEWSVLIFNV